MVSSRPALDLGARLHDLRSAHLFGRTRKRKPMSLYLTRFSYTPSTWAKLIKNPEDRRAAAKQYIEAVGGKMHGFWYAFGDHDAYALYEAPDNVSMAATAICRYRRRCAELLTDDCLADRGGHARGLGKGIIDHVSPTGRKRITLASAFQAWVSPADLACSTRNGLTRRQSSSITNGETALARRSLPI